MPDSIRRLTVSLAPLIIFSACSVSSSRVSFLRATPCSIAFSPEQSSAQLQCCVVRDAELPVGRDSSGRVPQVPLHNSKEVLDFLPASWLSLEPTIKLPLLQTHPQSPR